MSASVWEPGANLVTIDAESTNLSQVFIATESQVIFNLTSFSYAVGTGSLAVYRGGQRLILGTDWSETSSTSISLTGFTISAGEIIEVVAVIGAASAASITAQAAAVTAGVAQVAAEAAAASIDTATLLTKAGNLSGLASASASRTNLGLNNPVNYPVLNQSTTGSAATAANLLGRAQLGTSGTAAQNFTLTAEAADGTMKLARGNAGATSQDILTVDATGKVSVPQSGLQFPKAWVNFNGTTGAIRSSYNVSSVTRVAAGDYRININAGVLADANYAVQLTPSNSGTTAPNTSIEYTEAPTTTTVRVNHANNTGTRVDCDRMCVVIFGN